MGGLSGRLLGSAAALTGLAVMMFLLLVRPEDRTPDENGGNGGDIAQLSDANTRCDRELARILNGMRPGRMGISSDRIAMTDELNRWILNCRLSDAESAITGDRELLESILKGETLARVQSDRYLPQDSSHIRESLLARSIVDTVTADATSETDRINALFDFVVRYIALLPPEASEQTPLTPYEAMLFGVGTAADRAWTFATLLRQMRLDAVILEPAEAESTGWLVGVIIPREGVLLFDPALGMMVPSLSESEEPASPFPLRPATLAEVLEQDEALRALDLPDSPYPLSSAKLKDFQVRVIGGSSLFAPRMAELQFMLPAGVNVDLYDGLGENTLRQPGLLARIVEAGAGDLWTEEQISLWEYPDRQRDRIEAARSAEGTQLSELFTIFSGPYVPRQDPRTQAIYQGTAEFTLHYVRVEQLMGEHADALKHYLPIRTSFKTTPVAANQIAADYAAMWTGVSQFETGRYPAAMSTFERYIAGHADGLGFTDSAIEWAVRCHVAEGRLNEAIALLENSPSRSPRREAYLVNRWRTMTAGEE
jgi:hypothetical protein